MRKKGKKVDEISLAALVAAYISWGFLAGIAFELFQARGPRWRRIGRTITIVMVMIIGILGIPIILYLVAKEVVGWLMEPVQRIID